MAQDKFDKTAIEGFPEGGCTAVINGVRRVFYAYCYSIGGKRFSERDYLGHIQDGKFIPNDYYRYAKPPRLPRPLEFWSNPEKRRIEEAKLKASEKLEPAPANPEQDRPSQPSLEEATAPFDSAVGATALCAAMLYENGFIADLCRAIQDPQLVLDAINLAIHSAITCDPTYLAKSESRLQKFIGTGCPSSQRASEVHAKLGVIPDLSMLIGKARCSRLNEGDLLALDGTRIDCNSDGITLAAVGKRKEGDYGRQINFSVLFNATTGQALCYRAYAGNFNDVSTLKDFRNLWKNFGIVKYEPKIIVDRGYYKTDELILLNNDGIKFLVGAKTDLNCIKSEITEKNERFFDFGNLIEDSECFCVEKAEKLSSPCGEAKVKVFIYRNAMATIREANSLRRKLKAFEEKWAQGKADSKAIEAALQSQAELPPPDPDEKWDDASPANLLYFFKRPWVKGKALVFNPASFSHYCYTLGFFALVTNDKTDGSKTLADYGIRNEVEVFFKKQKEMFRTTRVQSDETLQGLMLTVFIAASIRAELVHRLKKMRENQTSDTHNDQKRPVVNSVAKLLSTLQRIRLVRYENGHHELLDVTSNERNVIAGLGFPDLFDSADKVASLLSAQRLLEEAAKR